MTLHSETIGFIGFGNMAKAIYKGLISNNQKLNIIFTEKDNLVAKKIEQEFPIKSVSKDTIYKTASIIIIAVKPQQYQTILQPISNKKPNLIISILAGITMTTLEKQLGEHVPIIRCMPNTPALLQQGMSGISFNKNITEQHQEIAKTIFEGIGKMKVVPENVMDTVTGISGSGPAFFYQICHDIAELANNQGLSYEDAIQFAAQTLIGAGHMLLNSNKSPETLIQEVSSPNGTTVAGLQNYKSNQVNKQIQAMIQAAITRSKELSKHN
ncbi:pyrroline-5-carboxylate reductase [Candidatus Marinamargulisbacteria bacterium SCGC AG-410-N11]|nr:pyrroline-5-carboxylate reductase [Candidatus Marinamargulisbacteria bacterium SCGC AG-410-N11]